MAKSPGNRTLLEDVLSRAMVRELWTANYDAVFPMQPGNFSIGTLLPALLFLMRRGAPRGRGGFLETYGQDGRRATVEDVAERLCRRPDVMVRGEAGHAILGDVILAHCLETVNHSASRQLPVDRAYASHYFASWLDLPQSYANMRNVPDALASILVRPDRIGGDGSLPSEFPVGSLRENLLLKTFAAAVEVGDRSYALTADRFVEGAADALSVEQLAMVRIAQELEMAPRPSRGDQTALSNQLPLDRAAAEVFREDFRVFLTAYGEAIGLPTLVPMMECALAIGLTNMALGSARQLRRLFDDRVTYSGREPWPLFVDASEGGNPRLRQLAEESMDQAERLMRSLPVSLMALRLLESLAQDDEVLSAELPPPSPDGTMRVRFLLEVLTGGHHRASTIKDRAGAYCRKLARACGDDEAFATLLAVLDEGTVHPVLRLADGAVRLMGSDSQELQFAKLLGSSLVADEASPHRIAVQRRVTKVRDGVVRRGVARSLTLNNTALDYLVHRHLWEEDARHHLHRRPVTYRHFLALLRERYGFYVDAAPPGLPIAMDNLRQNRYRLERRLRDLGLLGGVNDAETMKFLRPRLHDRVTEGTNAPGYEPASALGEIR